MQEKLEHLDELSKLKISIGKQVKLYRTESQEMLAEKALLSRDTISDVECGNVMMGIDTLIKLCNALNITPNDICEDYIDKKFEGLNIKIKQELSSINLSTEEVDIILKILKYFKEKRN